MGRRYRAYRAGWFRLKRVVKHWYFSAIPARAVAIPTNDDYTLVISPADPEAFLAQLRRAQ